MITRLNFTQHVTFVVHFETAKTLTQSYVRKYTFLVYIVIPGNNVCPSSFQL